MALRREQHPDINVNDLDYHIVHQICQDFDIDRSWELLAGAIGYSIAHIQTFDLETRRADGSPTRKLLWDWGTRGGSVRNLYDKLALINKTRCMRFLEHIMKEDKSKKKVENVKQDETSLMSKDNTNLMPSSLEERESCNINPNSLPIPMMKKPVQKIPADVNLNFNTSNSPDKGGAKQMKFDKVIKVMSEHQGAASVEVNECHADGPASAKENLEAASSSVRSLERVKSVLEENGASVMFTPRLSQDENAIARALISTPSYTYKELSQATGGFSVEYKLGQGKFGCVYHGLVKNTKCAIKKLRTRQEKLEEEKSSAHLAAELKALSRYHHENIVSLYGYALDGYEVCLVYQFMQNGSLDDCLHCKNGRCLVLSWEQRLSILRGAACGLQFLHTVDDKPVIHGDIKSANILLDRHFDAKIGDLGLAQQATSGENGHKTHITKKNTTVIDYVNRAYLAPEQLRGNTFSVKGDTYAFGVVMFETLTGQEAYDERREGSVEDKYLVEYLSETVSSNPKMDRQKTLQDPRLDQPFPTTMFVQMFDQAELATTTKKRDRPNMTEVYKSIAKIEQLFQGQEYNNVQELTVKTSQENGPDIKKQCFETTANEMSYTSAGYQPSLKTGLRPLPKVVIPKPEAEMQVMSPVDMLDKNQEPPLAFKLQMVHDKKGDVHCLKEKIANEDKVEPVPEYENIEKKMKDMNISDTDDLTKGEDMPKSDSLKAKNIEGFYENNFAKKVAGESTLVEKEQLKTEQTCSDEQPVDTHQYINVSDVNRSATESEDVEEVESEEGVDSKEQSEHEEIDVEEYNLNRETLDQEYEAIHGKRSKGSLMNNLFNYHHGLVYGDVRQEEEYCENDSESSTITDSINNDIDMFNSDNVTDEDLFDQGCQSGRMPAEHGLEEDSAEASLERHQHNFARYSQMANAGPDLGPAQRSPQNIGANYTALPPEPYEGSWVPQGPDAAFGPGSFHGAIISNVPEGFQDSVISANMSVHSQGSRSVQASGGFTTGGFQMTSSVEAGPSEQPCSGGFVQTPSTINQLNDISSGGRVPTEGEDCYV